jgi:hypothetical protein
MGFPWGQRGVVMGISIIIFKIVNTVVYDEGTFLAALINCKFRCMRYMSA